MGTTTVTVNGLPSNANGYNVYVYADGDNGGATRSGTYQISGTGITTTNIGLTDAANTNFAGTFTQANNSNGNYVVFTIPNVAGFMISAIPGAASDTQERAPVNGIQIVPISSTTPDFTIGAMPGTATVVQGSSVAYTVSVGALNGFTGSVSLSVSGLPAGATFAFSPASVTPGTNSTLTITAAANTPTGGPTTLTITGTSGSLSHTTTVTLTVTPDTTPPTVSITSPTSGATVSGTITVTASASDDVAVASVDLQVDGTNVGAADTTSPYSFSLDTTTLSNGSHNLTAVAIDTSGNQAASAAVGITISNQSGSATAAYANNGAGCPINTVPGGPTDLVTSYTCPLPNPTGAGNLLVMWVRYSNANSPTLSFTTNLGTLTATQAVSCLDNANNQTESRLYYVANVPAGINVVTVNFSTSSSYVQLQPYEFYNVATTSALDRAVCQVSSGTSISSGALPDLSTSGDLVVQFSFADNGTAISSCAMGSQSNIIWKMRAALIASPEPMCFQYGNYNSTTSFSPTMTFGTSVNYVSLSAAFKAANAGTPPGSGIRVVYVQHDDGYSQGANALKFQLPISGNLAVEQTSAGCSSNTLSSCPYPTGFSDGTNTWNLISGAQYLSSTGSSQETVGSNWYASNIAPGYYTLNVTQHGCTGGCAPFPDSYIMFDIVGASANPLDLGFGGAGNGLASISNISATSAPITTFTAAPSGPNELILAQAGYEWDTFTGLTSPNGAQFLSAYYTAETNYSWCDLNGGWGLLYNGSSTAPVTWTWAHDSSQFPGAGRGLALGVAFK
jgi:hypothetical protein